MWQQFLATLPTLLDREEVFGISIFETLSALRKRTQGTRGNLCELGIELCELYVSKTISQMDFKSDSDSARKVWK